MLQRYRDWINANRYMPGITENEVRLHFAKQEADAAAKKSPEGFSGMQEVGPSTFISEGLDIEDQQ